VFATCANAGPAAICSGVSLVVLPAGREVEPSDRRAIHCLEDGRVVVWEPGTSCGPIACHAEPIDRAPRETLVRRYGLPRSRVAYACAFSRAHVAATLGGVPVWSLLQRGGRQARAAHVRTKTLVRPDLGLVVSLGVLL
jgi:hypothetical protein